MISQPLLWGFYQFAGLGGPAVLCTVRSREEAQSLADLGFEVFPLVAGVTNSHIGSEGLTAANLSERSNGGTGSTNTSAASAVSLLHAEIIRCEEPPQPKHATGSRCVNSVPASEIAPSASPLPPSATEPHDSADQIRQSLRRFAKIAEEIAEKEDDETLFSLQVGPLQWKHITAGDLKRVGAALALLRE